MVNLITDETDVFLLKLNVNNCADISQNLKRERSREKPTNEMYFHSFKKT